MTCLYGQCDQIFAVVTSVTNCCQLPDSFSSVTNGDHAEVFRKAEEVIERVVAHIDGSREICKTQSKSRELEHIL